MAVTDNRAPAQTLIIACGALAHEITALLKQPGLHDIRVKCLPADLHNRPQKIPGQVRQAIHAARGAYEQIFVAYGDCGTGGLLDKVLKEENVERLPGPHCYSFFAGPVFEELHASDPGTFYLTDYLVRFFERLIWRGLKLDQHPELFATYFAHYNKLAYLAQTKNRQLRQQAEAIAQRMNLEFIYHYTGYGELKPAIETLTVKRS